MANHNPLKQRIVGALVLISLAVIFFPMMLDSHRPEQGIRGSNIPPNPDGEINAIEFELDASTTDGGEEESAAMPFLRDLFKGFRLFNSADDESAPPSPESPGEPVHAWMVQLATFTARDNAIDLRDKLRRQDYPTFVHQERGEKGTLWTVRVGPEHSPQTADELRAELAQATGLKPIVVRHVP